MADSVGPNHKSSHYVHWWYVAFLHKQRESWWDYLSPEHLRHVICFGYSAKNRSWVIVDPTEKATFIRILRDDFEIWYANLIATDPIVYHIEAQEGSAFSNRIFQTCSSIVGRIIGLRGSAWRPSSLLKILQDEKAVRKHPQHEPEGQTP